LEKPHKIINRLYFAGLQQKPTQTVSITTFSVGKRKEGERKKKEEKD
jgi:hypothetical protein